MHLFLPFVSSLKYFTTLLTNILKSSTHFFIIPTENQLILSKLEKLTFNSFDIPKIYSMLPESVLIFLFLF